MINVISFCLWGKEPRYCIGLVKNIELAKKYYPNWKCWCYIHEPSVNKDFIKSLESYDNVKVILKNNLPIRNLRFMLWRIEPLNYSEVKYLISRDTDTRIQPREVMAVQEWIESGNSLHIMRDHFQHYPKILGGMFGIKSNKELQEINWIDNIEEFYEKNGEEENDQHFLEKTLYKIYEKDRIIHDEIKLYEGKECKEYPIPFERNGNFVGCYIYEDDNNNKDNANSLLHYISYLKPNRLSKYRERYEEQLEFISSFFKDIYVMHYTKLVDRKQSMEKQLKNMLFYNFFNVHWIDKFDREVITQEMIDNNYKYDPEVLGRPITLPEIANGIAHIHIIENIKKVGLVLEDDTIFKPDFVHHLYHILKNLPPDWEIICLGGPTEEGVYPNNTIPGSIRNEFKSNEIVFAKPSSRAIQTMSCFLINEKGRDKFLTSKYFKPYFSGPIDHIAWLASMEKEIELYWTQPWISYEGSKIKDKFETTMERGF